MTLIDLLDGVEAALKQEWETAPVYRDRRPADFTRPSFLVEGGPVTSQELGGNITEFTAQVRVTAFTEVDPYHNSQTAQLVARMSEMMALFAGGYIKIGSRAPHVVGLTGDYGFDYAEVIAQLRWTEAWLPGEEYPLMLEIETKIETK